MAKKLDSIVQLAAQTARQISANGGNYMAFLTTAAHNFKYSFRDQLLIFAQKPDATACAQIDFWNEHGRWVNRGTTGIALLVDTDKGYKLRHVFDMSDTNSRAGRIIPVWQMKPQYEGAVIEALENSYGELTGKPDFGECLMAAAKIIVEDNFSDYYDDLRTVKAGSLLEELDDDSTKAWFKGLLENSVAYMMLARCGIDPREYFTGEEFTRIYDFNTLKTLAILGVATSDIAEMPLREIATTVLSLYREEQKQNRTFAERPDARYNNGRIQPERSVEHGYDVQNGRRLSPAQPGRAGGPEGRKIWDAAAKLPGQSPARDLHRDASVRGVEQSSGGDRPGGHRDGEQLDGENGGGAGRDGGTESVRSNEVGGPDEQYSGVGGGSSADGAGVRLTDPLPSEEEQRQAIKEAEDEQSSAFSISQEDIDAVLLHGSGVADGKFRIYEQFETVWNSGENAPFLKKEYKSTTYFSVTTDKKLNVWCDTSGLKISIGKVSEPQVEVKLTWKKMAKRISQLVEVERYLSPAEQEQYPEYQRQHDTRATRVNVSEEFWSIVNDYNDYWTQLGQKDKCLEGYPLALCRSAFASGQKKIYQTREGKYILPLMREAMQAIIGENTHLTERCEAMLAELSGPLATPLEPTEEELNPPPKDYRLSLGATVYLGAQEYELLAFDGQTVRLFDPSFPLINKELPRIEFDRLLAQNPQNDHLAEDVLSADGPQAVGRIDYLNKDGTARESIEYTDAEHLIAKIKEESDAAAPMRIVVYRDTEGRTIPLDFIKDLHPLRQKLRVVDYEDRYWKETPGYDLGYGHLGNGLTVWNSLEEEYGDYKTIAHISPDRTVKFYVDDLPEDVRAQIEHIAATSDATISATQDAPVFSTPPLGRGLVSVSFWNDYNSIKEHDPDSLLLYQVGDFFELYGKLKGEDANTAASVLNLTLTTRTIPDIGRVSMCGFPVHKLDDCVDRLTGAGFDVNVARVEGNRHKVQHIPAPDMERAKRLINEFCMDEYDTEADFSDLRNVALAHSATGDGKHAIDVSADLIGCYLFYQVDGEVVVSLQCLDLNNLNNYLANLDFDEMVAYTESQYERHEQERQSQQMQRIRGERNTNDLPPAQAAETAGPQYEIRDTPYIFCEWSESIAFQDKTAYSLSEFDRLMKQADDEYTAGSAAAMKKYGTWQKWYDANDPEYKAFLSYEKVKFTVVLPDGRTFTERQDVGDGDGGVLDYLSKFDAYREIVPILREAAQQEAETSQGAPETQPGTDDFSDIDPAAVRAALAEHGIVDGHVVDLEKLDASPFIQQVMADVEQIATDAPPPDERFSIIETENGYAVWDDARNEIYVDSEGVQEEFPSEWQAEDYLKQIRQAMADKEAAEWLTVERAKQGISPQGQAEKEEKEGVENIASYQSGDERIVISRYPNGKYYNRYGYDEQRDFSTTTAGGFDTFEEAEKTLLAHRPKAEKVLEPAEKEATAEKGAESLADGHSQDENAPPLAPPAPRRRAKVSPFVLHPEIPSADRHEYRITNDAIGVGTPGERYKNNIRAIRLLKKLEAEDRFATPEEQAVLAQYVGWGGLADCFDERHSKYAELKALLTEDEYEAAAESTLTAFYTPPVVIRSIYQALENMGFKTGNMLEPSCGVGNFIGMRPDDLADSKIYGIELDSISGRIARQLYQKSSIAVQGFEKTDLPDSFFDAAIGNVPFGAFKVSDKRYDKHNFLIHDYFFARTLDKVRPGGIIAFVTSKGTMDKENPSVRKYIAQRADLLGAIRLPNNTFKDAAGTEVTSDILFFQKQDALSCEEPDWVHLNTDENGLKMNQYFIDHPEMVMGEMQEVSGPYGPETACLPIEGQDLGEQLAAAIQNIQGSVTEYVMDDPEAEEEDQSIPADPEVRNFSYTVVDGQVYYRENSRMNPVEVSVTAANRIKGLIEIRDCVRTLIEYQTDDWPDENIQAEQQKLNALYDAYVKKYGRISSRANSAAFRMDSAYFLLSSLEVLDDDRNFVRKADMFTKRTIKQKTVITSVDTASEALAVSLAEKACVDLGYMASLMGGGDKIPQVVEDLKGVIFKDPLTGPFDIDGDAVDWYKGWQTADEYLSGNVREKLAEAMLAAESDPAFQINVEALEKVQPVDLTASEISVRLGSTWLPPKVVEQFVFELLGTLEFAQEKIHVHYAPYTGEWNVEGKSVDKENVKANSTYGTERINAYKIIEDTLNLRDVRIFDYSKDSSGKRIAILNKQETAIAQGKQELIKQEFRDWIWKDPERREMLTQLYNDQFNSNRPREYDGSHLNFVGMNPEITLRKHQRDAIAHILYGGNTLLGHVVGAGKTWEMVAAAQESKRLGLCQKSLFVVPNHLTEQWATEYLQLYPSANILVATNKDFETKNRKRFCGRIATGDYDAIIIGHSQFEKVPMSTERQIAILRQQRREIVDGIRELKESKGEHFSRKQMERTKKSIEAKLEELNDQSRKDDVVTFEELGVDRIFIDEAHYFKNLASFSKMRNVGGIAQTEAQKASDLYMKCRYLDEITGGRGIIFATGTPISNTMVEMFTMQKYLQYNTLKRHGLLHFDSWASTFGETVTAIELAPEGTGYRSKTRFAKFYNLPELMSMFKEVADIQTADMLNLPVPKANYHNVILKPSNLQEEMVEGLAERAERIRNKMVRSDEDNMLLVTNDGRKLALDQRLLNPMLPDSDTSKTNACADNVFEIWQRTAEQRSTQMIFCDLSTPGTHRPIEMTQNDEGTFEMASFQNVYDDLRDKLIARGIPAEEIAFVHDANTETKKKELFGKVRSGQIRILLGSTQRMGAGTNVQHKLIALHHLDCPWRPSDLQQREGRIIRQKNENDEVDIYTYVTENTFDSYLYQMVENKQKFIGQIMTSKSPVRSAEDIDETALSYAEIKALCTGDDRIKEKMDLDIDVQRLKLLKSSHLSQKYALEDQILRHFPHAIAVTKGKIKNIQEDIAIRDGGTHPNADGFSPMVVKGATYAKKKDAGYAILAACKSMFSSDPIQLGQYRGFTMELCFDAWWKEHKLTLIGSRRNTVSLGTDLFGNIQRIDNMLDYFESELKDEETSLANYEAQLASAKVEVEKPFPQEDELNTKSARLNQLNIELNLDKQENEIVDGEPDESASPPARDNSDRER